MNSSGAGAIRVASATGATDNTTVLWTDYTVGSEVDYFYQVKALAADGRSSSSGWIG